MKPPRLTTSATPGTIFNWRSTTQSSMLRNSVGLMRVALQIEAEDLADRAGQRAQRGLDAVRQVGVLQPLLHLLPREVVVDRVVKRDVDERQAELRVREEAHRMRQPAELDLQRDGDLLLDFFGRVARKQRDHRDLNIGHVRKRLDRQGVERRNSGADEQHQQQNQEQRLMDRERNDFPDHGGRWVSLYVGGAGFGGGAIRASYRTSNAPKTRPRFPRVAGRAEDPPHFHRHVHLRLCPPPNRAAGTPARTHSLPAGLPPAGSVTPSTVTVTGSGPSLSCSSGQLPRR